MTAAAHRHRHRAAPAPRVLPSWCRARTAMPVVALGVVAASVLTSAGASPRVPVATAQPPQDDRVVALAVPAPDTVTAPADATWTAPDADVAWLEQAIEAELARIAAEQAEAERLAAEAAAAAAAQEEAARQTARREAARGAARQQGAASVPVSTPVGDVKEYAASLVGAEQFGCLDALFTRESGWNPSAKNKSSGAYGIPQALPASKMASAGADWQTNPHTQVRWGVSYVNARYGSACGAWAHSESHGWY